MLSIGEFSKATALTVKTLRHYHARGILVPTHVDPKTGYRYYGGACVERAAVIKALRELEFSLDEVAEILASCDDDADALDYLERRQAEIAARLAHLESIHGALDRVIRSQRDARTIMQTNSYDIETKTLTPTLVAGLRMRGRYDQSGEGFKRLGRALGFAIAGKPGMLIYDEAYEPEHANFEVFFPLARAPTRELGDDIEVRELPGGPCLSLIHRGPYDQISTAYARLFARLHELGEKAKTPSREIYIKGPGMVFRGNPKRYLTEVQIPIERPA